MTRCARPVRAALKCAQRKRCHA